MTRAYNGFHGCFVVGVEFKRAVTGHKIYIHDTEVKTNREYHTMKQTDKSSFYYINLTLRDAIA